MNVSESAGGQSSQRLVLPAVTEQRTSRSINIVQV